MRGDILSTDKHRLEKEVEQKWCDVARKKGWIAYKFSSPGNSSVPDRLFIRQSTVFFIEFKRPGKTMTDNQLIEKETIMRHGIEVWMIDWFDKEFVEFLFE